MTACLCETRLFCQHFERPQKYQLARKGLKNAFIFYIIHLYLRIRKSLNGELVGCVIATYNIVSNNTALQFIIFCNQEKNRISWMLMLRRYTNQLRRSSSLPSVCACTSKCTTKQFAVAKWILYFSRFVCVIGTFSFVLFACEVENLILSL